ncbi:hypothetical protein GTW40_07410 [Streptomyces sp. SID4985]|uniref:hypothetical protein n=1 Tax=Streptomyces sp. SID4985 TaxID=2690292 RepID=UPI0013700B69|nr:hypothetical protein [Streptomyces sp. SID4985]MYQ44891.1 hypothetical protein [Streptomyces sp. SID4985]
MVGASLGGVGSGLSGEYADRAVLTACDIVSGSHASGDQAKFRLANAVVIEAGDVLMPRVVSVRGGRVRVADDAKESVALLGTGLIGGALLPSHADADSD